MKIKNKKLKKLLRDPKLFFKDMYQKRKYQVQKFFSIQQTGTHNFTVVTAVYNVEKYLDQYFVSLTKQNLNFRKHITLILVDDGSTDSSAKIIKKWQRKYPKNIKYFYKVNGGQASARNLGISYVESDWLTFIDPDDFISPDYFLKVDNILASEEQVSILTTPIAVYKEFDNSYHYDTTPLTYCFKDHNKKFPISDLKNKIQLSVCTAFFKANIIKENNLIFDEKVKPCFEDGRFVTDYFLLNDKKYIYFLDNTYYFYRVRKDNSSTTNTQWGKKEKYLDVFKYGYLEMFKSYKSKYNNIPLNIQMTFLFFAIQYIKIILQKRENSVNFLSTEEKNQFIELFHECFSFIEKKSIMKFHLHGCNFFYKLGMINLFKKENPDFLMIYFEKIDQKKNLIEFYFYGKNDIQIDYFCDGEIIFPIYKKIKEYKFLEESFIYEYRIWLPIDRKSSNLKFISSLPLKISYNKQEYLNSFPIGIVNYEYDKNILNNPWVFIDKNNQANDNAEHLYQYVSKTHPEQEIYFALDKSSPDWHRLDAEGFNLLDFGSLHFQKILKKSSVILSSHADRYFMEYFGKNTLKDKKFIFLQHGVIMHDLSSWLNNVSKISLFCTSTPDEYNFISGINSPYKYSHEVKLTGLARHDSLLQKSKNHVRQKNILIMPTWRNHVVGALKQGSVSREINLDFQKTDYFKYWYNFLHSQELQEMVNHYQYTLTFIPHPNISDYLNLFEIPEYIEQPSLKPNFSIQDCLVKSSIMITDYSSISFDMAYLEKSTIYYQFDAKDFFSGSHTSNKGYFSYTDNGFGPVVTTQDDLIKQLHLYLKRNCDIPKKYLNRIEIAYPNRDTNNCNRIYKEIVNL